MADKIPTGELVEPIVMSFETLELSTVTSFTQTTSNDSARELKKAVRPAAGARVLRGLLDAG